MSIKYELISHLMPFSKKHKVPIMKDVLGQVLKVGDTVGAGKVLENGSEAKVVIRVIYKAEIINGLTVIHLMSADPNESICKLGQFLMYTEPKNVILVKRAVD